MFKPFRAAALSLLVCLSFLVPRWAAASQNCWEDAANRYRIDPWLLYAIATQESSLRTGVINVNKDGTEDLGLMGINTRWLPMLAQYGITRQKLLEDPCTNINIGAWVLAENFARYGVTWNSVGIYNAGTARNERQQQRRDAYAAKIARIYGRNIAKYNLQGG